MTDDKIPNLPLHPCNSAIVKLCALLGGHRGEGQVVDGRCVGRCTVCGIGMLTDGS